MQKHVEKVCGVSAGTDGMVNFGRYRKGHGQIERTWRRARGFRWEQSRDQRHTGVRRAQIGVVGTYGVGDKDRSFTPAYMLTSCTNADSRSGSSGRGRERVWRESRLAVWSGEGVGRLEDWLKKRDVERTDASYIPSSCHASVPDASLQPQHRPPLLTRLYLPICARPAAEGESMSPSPSMTGLGMDEGDGILWKSAIASE